MKSLINIPFTTCFVRRHFLRAGETGVIRCYLVAVELVLNEALRWMILTDEGALYNSVPLHALCWKEEAPPAELNDLCTWDALGDRGEIVELAFLKSWTVERKQSGSYLFSIHFDPSEHWPRLPEQLKIFHFCEREDGNYMIAVNNETRFICEAVTKTEMTLRPESNKTIWFSEK